MYHEKIIKRDDGSRVMIRVEFLLLHRDGPEYRFRAFTCEPRKRTFKPVLNEDDYGYRRLKFNSPERESWAWAKYMTVTTKEEIAEAKNEMWQKLKPI